MRIHNTDFFLNFREELLSSKRSPSSSKKTTNVSKSNIFSFFLFCWAIFAHLAQDPHKQNAEYLSVILAGHCLLLIYRDRAVFSWLSLRWPEQQEQCWGSWNFGTDLNADPDPLIHTLPLTNLDPDSDPDTDADPDPANFDLQDVNI